MPGLRPAQVDDLARRLRSAAAELRSEGRSVEWLRSVALLEDEACLCSFRAATAADVDEANVRAEAGYDRIVAAHETENAAPAVL